VALAFYKTKEVLFQNVSFLRRFLAEDSRDGLCQG
jgi:hypothetical protein